MKECDAKKMSYSFYLNYGYVTVSCRVRGDNPVISTPNLPHQRRGRLGVENPQLNKTEPKLLSELLTGIVNL